MARVRLRTILLQMIDPYVMYAQYSGEHTNPYPATDKRHKLFTKKLAEFLRQSAMFDDMTEVYGEQEGGYQRRVYPHPGPVQGSYPIVVDR